eukprot:2284486-Pleurochrysis_carterae.AAC.1
MDAAARLGLAEPPSFARNSIVAKCTKAPGGAPGAVQAFNYLGQHKILVLKAQYTSAKFHD